MKKYKKLLIALGILVVIAVAVIIVTTHQKKQEDIRISGETILTVNEANATAITWNSEENNYGFHRGSDGRWVYDKDEVFPVSQDEMEDVFDLFRELTAAFVIEHVEDFAQYGLKDPVSTVTITTTERQEDVYAKETQARGQQSEPGELRTVTIQIGAFSVMDEQRYISIGDGNVYLVKKDPYETLNVPEKMMIQNDRIPYFSNIKTADGTALGTTFTIGYDSSNYEDWSYTRGDYYYMDIDGKRLPLDPDVSLKYFTSIVNTTLQNYATYKVRDDELKLYGLDDPEYYLALDTFTKNNDGTMTEDQFTLRISRDPEYVASIGKEVPEGEEAPVFKAYLRKDDSPIIYELTEAQYKTLTAMTYNDLRHKKMMPADMSDVESIDFTVDGQTYTITSILEDNVRTHYYDGNPLNMTNLKNALTSLTASEFTTEAVDGQEELTVVFHLSSEKFPTVTLTCIRKDGNNSLILVDGKPEALVMRTRMNALREALIKISLGNDIQETTAAE